MKKILVFLLAAFLLLALTALPALATDNGEDDRIEAMEAAAEGETPEAAIVATTHYGDPDPAPVPGEPLTWEYLATIAGATAATLLIVQFLKVPLDRIWKIPTRAFVYFIALVMLLAGTYFTTGLTWNTALLTAVNAVIVAFAAYGSYEVFLNRKNK